MIKKVFFIGDYYRGDQEQNIKNLYTLLSPIFVDIDIQTFLLNDIHQKELKVVWKESLDKQGESVLSEYDLSSSLIIAFEINPLDKLYLDANKIPWIDVEIHPIRFLDDLYFSIKTSIDYDFTELHTSQSYIQFSANILKSEYKDSKCDIEPNSLLIIGQTPIDKSIYHDSEFKNILDYSEELDKICSNYTKIYYRSHPYLTDEKIDEEIVSRYNASMLMEKSYYELLACDNLSAVCGISSSSLHEAKYFFKNVLFLEERIKKYTQPISLKSFMENDKFWEQILGQNINFLKYKLIFNIPENTCRNIYAYWSFESQEMKLEGRLNKKLNDITGRVSEVEVKANEVEATVNEAEIKLTEVELKTNKIEFKANEMEFRVNEVEARANEYLNLYNSVLNSKSWKITKPLRETVRLVKKIKKGIIR